MFARKKNIKLRQQRVDILMHRMNCTNDDGSTSGVPHGVDTESGSNVLSKKEQEERDRLIAERLSREYHMERVKNLRYSTCDSTATDEEKERKERKRKRTRTLKERQRWQTHKQ